MLRLPARTVLNLVAAAESVRTDELILIEGANSRKQGLLANLHRHLVGIASSYPKLPAIPQQPAPLSAGRYPTSDRTSNIGPIPTNAFGMAVSVNHHSFTTSIETLL
jgi:hypothetical protein